MSRDASAAVPISRIGEPRVVYSNRHGSLMDDDVRGPRGDAGRYLRWRWAGSGVIIVPFDGERFYLWEMYRYPLGAYSWEFPRGATEPGESVGAAAARELAEETGATVQETMWLGELCPDTGLIAGAGPVVLARVTPGDWVPARRPEPFEAIGDSIALRATELTEYILAARVRCALTIASFLLARARLDG